MKCILTVSDPGHFREFLKYGFMFKKNFAYEKCHVINSEILKKIKLLIIILCFRVPKKVLTWGKVSIFAITCI